MHASIILDNISSSGEETLGCVISLEPHLCSLVTLGIKAFNTSPLLVPAWQQHLF